LRRDPLRGLLEAHRRHGDVVRFKLGALPFYLINDPGAIRKVLVDDADVYVKGSSHDTLRLVLGDSLSTANGETWRRKRELIQPAFHRAPVDASTASIARVCAELSRRWSELPDRSSLDVHEEMVALAFRVTVRALFDAEIDSQRMGYVSQTLNRYLRARTRALIKLPIWLPTPANRRFHAAKLEIDRVVREIIQRHEAAHHERDDILTRLTGAHSHGHGNGHAPSDLNDEVVNLLSAGMETANALSFAWYMLSLQPAVHRRLVEEVDAVLQGRLATAEDLPKLVYTESVVSETLRLFSPVWLFGRTATRKVELGSVQVEAGSMIGISPWTLHRHPVYWSNPEGFDPDRFATDATRTRFTYLPFGAGQRTCVGMRMAIAMAKLIVATLSQHHRLELVPGHPVELEPSFMLRPKHGIQMSLHKR
jgi:cytochrome P450